MVKIEFNNGSVIECIESSNVVRGKIREISIPDNWWFEDDGWGIVGWSFKCSKCNRDNRFVSSPDEDGMTCEHCRSDNYFIKEDIESIENTL